MKKMKEGSIKVQMHEVAYHRFCDMSFFEQYVPEGCELVGVMICHEFGVHDQGDEAWFSIEWKEKE
jgi:hypothetical protein